MITPYILYASMIVLSAICNAAMDRTGDVVAFNKSIFQHRNQKFWCKEISWLYARKIFGWKLDAWHIFKSSMIICWALAAIFFKSTGYFIVDLLLIGTIWNLFFNLFYNKLFKQ